MMASVKSAKAALVPLLFATLTASALSLTGCGNENNIVHKSEPKDDAITSVEEMPERLTEAMKSVSGCRMTIEQSNDVTWTLRDGEDSVGSVSIDSEDETVTIMIDEAESDLQAERMAHMAIASVLACNPSYDYSDAQDVALETITEDKCRDNGISYIVGTKGNGYVLIIEL